MQFYAIPEYTPGLLQEADRIAKILKEKRISLRAISRELIYRIFGQETAQRLYPQVVSEGLTEGSKEFERQMEEVILDKMKVGEWTTKGKIIEKMQESYDWRSITDKRVRKCLPSLLEKHGLMEIITNKELKHKYGVNSSGYPRIIIHKADESSMETFRKMDVDAA